MGAASYFAMVANELMLHEGGYALLHDANFCFFNKPVKH